MNQELKYPARCSGIPAEEQQQISGGAPAWVENIKAKLEPYQPYFEYSWHVFLVVLSCGNSLYQIMQQTKTINEAVKNIAHIND